VVFYEINVSEEPVSFAVLGFDVRHCVVAQADVRPNGEFGLTSTQILGENAVTVHAALSPPAGGRAVFEGTLSEQPFEILNTPSKPHVVQARTLSEPDTATLGLWPPAARGLVTVGLALRSSRYESVDDSWGTRPCQLVLASGATRQATTHADRAGVPRYCHGTEAEFRVSKRA
jgi:hypothetical protein